MKRQMRAIEKSMKDKHVGQSKSRILLNHEISIMSDSNLNLIANLDKEPKTEDETERTNQLLKSLVSKGIDFSNIGQK